jgi:hypothetical protein
MPQDWKLKYLLETIICYIEEAFWASLWKESLNSDGQQFHQYQQY